MEPIPPGSVIDGTPQLQVFMLLAIVALLAMYAVLLWAMWSKTHARERLCCPVKRRMATVVFGLAPGGARTEVLACSLFGRGQPLTCGTPCLRAAAHG